MEEFDYTPQGGYTGNDYRPENESEAGTPDFFKQFPYAFQPQKYGQLIRNKTGAMIGFVVLLVLACTVISGLSFLIFHGNTTVIRDQINELPDFYLQGGELFMAEDFTYTSRKDNIYVHADSDVESYDLDDAQKLYESQGYTMVVLVSHTNLIMESDGEYSQLIYRDFGNITVDKQWIMQVLLPFFVVFVVIGYVAYFVIRTLWYFVCAAFYMLVGMICAAIFHKKFAAGVLFKTAVYAKTLMFVVRCILSVLPLNIAIPDFVGTMITLAMMLFAFQVIPQKQNG